jgi:hypothetical protein
MNAASAATTAKDRPEKTLAWNVEWQTRHAVEDSTLRSRFHSVVEQIAEISEHMVCIDRTVGTNTLTNIDNTPAIDVRCSPHLPAQDE